MKRLFLIHIGVLMIFCLRLCKRIIRNFGEWMKVVGRKFVIWGTDETPRWNLKLFYRCYLADAEFHLGMDVYRGPVYAAFHTGDSLEFRMNWLAHKSAMGKNWEYNHGTGIIKLKGHGAPMELPNGDVWFMCDGGYAILLIGKPRDCLNFEGAKEIIRTHTYF